MLRISKHRDTTVSDKAVELENGARYRESGLVHRPKADPERSSLSVVLVIIDLSICIRNKYVKHPHCYQSFKNVTGIPSR